VLACPEICYNMLMDKPFKNAFFRFLVRWFVCSLGLWIAAALLGNRITYNNSFWVIVISGLVLAAINLVIKPILVILSLPAVLITLGLFMVIINGVTVFIASKLYTSLHVTDFWAAILAGMVIGLVNYLVTAIMEGI
jgi:putative membrane protein